MHACTPGIVTWIFSVFVLDVYAQTTCPQKCYCPSREIVECSKTNLIAIPERMDANIRNL